MNVQTPAQITKDQIIALCKSSVRSALERSMRVFREMPELPKIDAEVLSWVEEALSAMNKRLAELAGWESGLIHSESRLQYVRAQIAELEGELSRISGTPILIRDGRDGGAVYADIPPGGALLDYETGIAEQAYQEWYSDLEAAKAALLLLQREHHGELSASGLHLNADPIRAYITRRETFPTLWVVNPMLDIRNTVDVYLDRDAALARCEDHERLRGVRVSPSPVRPGDPSYERHLANLAK